MQGINGGVHAAGAGKWAIVVAGLPPRTAMFHQPGKGGIVAQQDEGEAFVIPQQHIIRRPIALDQLCLQQQRLGLGVGGDDGHRAALADHALQADRQPLYLRVIGHPITQRPRLADIEHIAPCIVHAIDAGPQRQRGQHFANSRHARRDIRTCRTAQGGSCGILIEPLTRDAIWRHRIGGRRGCRRQRRLWRAGGGGLAGHRRGIGDVGAQGEAGKRNPPARHVSVRTSCAVPWPARVPVGRSRRADKPMAWRRRHPLPAGGNRARC